MLNVNEKNILADFKKAIRLNKHRSVIDIDERIVKKEESVLLRIESGLKEIGTEIPAHRHEHARLTIIYVAEGNGMQRIGDGNFRIQDHTLLIVPPGEVTSFSSEVATIRGYYISFNLDFFFQLHLPIHHLIKMELFKRRQTPYSYLQPREGESVERILDMIFQEGQQHRKNRNELIAIKILELILVCDRLMFSGNHKPPGYRSPVLLRYINLVNQHYKEHHTTRYYASRLNLHPNSLNALTKKLMNQSARTVIENKLLSEAQFLLYNSKLSVKEISFELGFDSPTSFFRFFKRLTHLSPLKYREKYLIL